jgi:aminoglycoside phosphotransferase (APT) family kinase protein
MHARVPVHARQPDAPHCLDYRPAHPSLYHWLTTLPLSDPARRPFRNTLQLAHVLAALHSLSPSELGLGGFGAPAHYCRRQLQRWALQYMASVEAPSERVLALVGWLQAHIPAADSDPSLTTICHGDYR